LAFSQLGFSLPDLTIAGSAGPRAAWGGTLNVSALLQNIGASTTTEPLSQAPATQGPITGSTYNSISSADAPASTVTVLISPTRRSLKGAVTLGTISAAALQQNSVETLTAAFTLPSRPAGFAGGGGKFYVWFAANTPFQFPEALLANNLSRPVAVKVESQALPELRAIALALPSSLQPGDTIVPEIQVENFGTADPQAQGGVTVDLVASVTPSFTVGSSIVASYFIPSIPAESQTPTRGNFKTFAKLIVNSPRNVATIRGTAVTLPTSPNTYFLGVVIDPQGTLNQLSVPKNNFMLIRVVGPPSKFLPPSGLLSNTLNYKFPNPPSGTKIGIA
jgi:hypothetical protein